MDVKISREIGLIRLQKGFSANDVAEKIGWTRENTYHHMKNDDMKISVLWQLSEALDFNLFSLFKPKLSSSEVAEDNSELTKKMSRSKIHADDLLIILKAKYNLEDVNKIAPFVSQVTALAAKFGFEMK
jgi:transcriptional regulator with XRE-family HTH domain